VERNPGNDEILSEGLRRKASQLLLFGDNHVSNDSERVGLNMEDVPLLEHLLGAAMAGERNTYWERARLLRSATLSPPKVLKKLDHVLWTVHRGLRDERGYWQRLAAYLLSKRPT
jgi:hypothetical protein